MIFLFKFEYLNSHKMENHLWNHLRGQICPVSTVGWPLLSGYKTFVIVWWCKSDFSHLKRTWTLPFGNECFVPIFQGYFRGSGAHQDSCGLYHSHHICTCVDVLKFGHQFLISNNCLPNPKNYAFSRKTFTDSWLLMYHVNSYYCVVGTLS